MFFFLISALLADPVVIDGISYILDESASTAAITTTTCPTSDQTLELKSVITSDGTQYTVTSIEENAFFGCEHYTGDLTVPDSITFIGYKAFANCGFSGSLTFNAPVDIDASLFSGSDKWEGSLIIGDQVPSIGPRAFDGIFTNGQSLSIGTGVKSIGSMAFYGCKFSATETLTIPSNVNKLGFYFIGHVSGPKHLNLQATIENLTQGDMMGLENFETLTISNTIRFSEKCLFGYKSFKTITFSNVQYLEEYAFANTSFDQSLVIPESVKSIKTGCFSHSSWTGDLTINANTEEIFPSVFSGAKFGGSKLTITNVKTIGALAFENCFSEKVQLSIQTIQIIGSMAFYGLDIENVVVPSSTTLIGRAAFTGITSKELVINANLEETNFTWFEGTNKIEKLVLGSTINTIAESSFAYCSNYKGGLTINGQIKAIENKAFYHCSGFSGSFTIPETVDSIGENSFTYATGFDGDLIINANVAEIDQTMFGESGFKGSLVIGSYVTTIGMRAFELVTSFKGTLTIGPNVETIGANAFYGTEFTGGLTIPSKVSSIQSHAFTNCKSIDSLTITSNNVNLSSYAFTEMPSLSSVTYCGYEEMKPVENAFDDTVQSINVNSIYLFDTVFGKPKKLVLCSVCNIQYPGHECIDPVPTNTPLPPKTQSPSQSPTSTPLPPKTQSPTASQSPIASQSPTKTPISGSTVFVPEGEKITITDSKVSDLILQGDATIDLETNSEITLNPDANSHKKVTITLENVQSSQVKVSSFDDVTIKVNSNSPLVFEDVLSATVESSNQITIKELKTHTKQNNIVFNAPNSQVVIDKVTINGQGKSVRFEGNSVVKDIQAKLDSTASLTNSEIIGDVELELNAELNLNTCSFKPKRADLYLHDFQSKTKLILNNAPSLSDEFDPETINVYITDNKAKGEVKIVQGIDEGKCTAILGKVNLPSSNYAVSCENSNIVVKAAEDSKDNGNEEKPKSNLLLYVIIGGAAVVVILIVVVVVIIIKKRSGNKDDNERSLSENMGSSLQSPLLF